MTTPIYKVRLKNQAGSLVAEFDDWRDLRFRHRVNYPGFCNFVISGGDKRRTLFELDGQIEIWRSYPEYGIDWYVEWEGFCRTPYRYTDNDGQKFYGIYAVGYLDLLARRVIAAYAGTDRAKKSGLGDVVIHDYVYENAGAGASIAAGRLLKSGVLSGLTVGGTASASMSWAGSRSFDNLLEAIQEIGQSTLVDFDIVGTGPATFIFETYPGQRGRDATLDTLDTSGPVIFALERGNMARAQYSLARTDEVTAVFVLGPGKDTNRLITLRMSADALNASPWNDREIARNANNLLELDDREALGDSILAQRQAQESFTFDILQVPGSLYGKHYTWGDYITAVYDDIERDKRIVGVDIAIEDDGQESISCTLQDVN